MKKITILILLICPFIAGCTPEAMQSMGQVFTQSSQSQGVVPAERPRYQPEKYRVYTGSGTPGQYTIERTY